MNPTNKSLAASRLGHDLQRLKWKAFKGEYAERRPQMEADLAELELELELPASIEEFEQSEEEIFHEVYEHLVKERSRLGGDVYALTSLVFGYVPLELVVSAAWKSENYEPLLWNLKLVLQDFGIEGDYEGIRHTIDTETEWLAQQAEAHGGDVRTEDAAKAALRLISRIGRLWMLAAKLDVPVRFDQVPYHSVFISYSTADEEFSRKLHERLSDEGLRVWFAPHDIKPGQKIHRQIYGAIEEYDKLLVVLSEASMKSEWVGTELWKARERERTQSVQVLFPIRLVPFEQIRDWSAFDADSGRDMARELREYFIPDLSGWRNDQVFEHEVDRLVEALAVTEAPEEESLEPAAAS